MYTSRRFSFFLRVCVWVGGGGLNSWMKDWSIMGNDHSCYNNNYREWAEIFSEGKYYALKLVQCKLTMSRWYPWYDYDMVVQGYPIGSFFWIIIIDHDLPFIFYSFGSLTFWILMVYFILNPWEWYMNDLRNFNCIWWYFSCAHGIIGFRDFHHRRGWRKSYCHWIAIYKGVCSYLCWALGRACGCFGLWWVAGIGFIKSLTFRFYSSFFQF